MSLRSRASEVVPLLLGAFALAFFNSLFVAHGTPVIIRQPVTVMDEIGKVSSLSVEATGDGPITYQWMTVGFDPNGHGADELYYPISGETNAVFTPGRLGPDSYAVAIYDQSGAVTSQLARIEVRDQVSLDAVAAWPGFPVKSTAGVLRNKTAFVFATDLHVIDISNPVEPRTLGIVDLQGQTRPARMIDAALSGPLLFAADTESRIWAFDVANASQPRLIGETQKQLETPGAISVFSNLVVATAGVEGIEVLRFDGLESTVLSHMDTPGSALGVALKGPIAYVADSDALLIVDLTAPSLPRLLKRLPIPASAVAVEGDRLFAAGASLHVLDIADAQNPVQTAELPLPSAIEKIIPRDQVLFLGSARESYIIGLEPSTRILSQVVGKQIAATDENLITVSNTTHVYDLSDLTAPTEVGAPRSFPTIWDYALKDGIVLAARGTNFVEIVDVRDPLAPRSLGTLRTAARALGIDLVGKVAAIACDIAGVELWDVTEAKAPLLLSNPRMGNELVNPTHRISNTALTTNRLYALSPRRIFLFDITDATQPIYKSTYILPADLSDILVRGTEIFCTTSDGIVRILDASNPSNIQQVGIYSGIRDYGGLSGIKGNFLYGNASGGVGQYILDISAPATPRLVVSRYGPTGGTLLEDLLVAGTSGRNVIFDASTPVQPAPVGRFSEDVSTGSFQKSGAWHYTVENALGASTRISIYKTANSAPLIHSHPGDVTVRYFENAYSISGGRLSIEVTGALPVDYQWYRGKRGDLSDPLPGATNNFYFFDPSGDLRQPVEKFCVRVTNKIGHANSRTATIYSVPYLQMRASGELRISSLPNSKWTLGSSSNLMNWTPERIIAIPEAPGSASSTVDITLNDRAEGTRFYRLQFIPEE